MEGKLIKRGDGDYKLFVNDAPYAQSKESPYKKLSLKNCQAIERGYDLDELACDECGIALDAYKFIKNIDTNKDIKTLNERYYEANVDGFKEGFQKALEIIGDKKFDINEVVELSKILISNPIEKCGKTHQELVDAYVKSLQQTEWDVTFNLDEKDEDGCLILKRK